MGVLFIELIFKGVKSVVKGAEVTQGVAKASKTVGRHVDDVVTTGAKNVTARKYGPKPGELEPNWGKELRKHGAGNPPKDMTNPHAHHTVFKKGRGKKMREHIEKSKDILEKYDIDWYKGSENLDLAPNKNHSTKAAKVVREALEKADTEIGTSEAVIDALNQMKKHFAEDTIDTLF